MVQRFREVSPWRLDVWLLLVLWMLGRATRSAPGNLAGRSGRLFLCLNGSGRRRFLAAGRGRRDAGARRRAAVADQHGDHDRALFRDLLAGRASFDEAFASGQIDWFGADADRDLFKRIVAIPSDRRDMAAAGAAPPRSLRRAGG